MNKKLPIVVIGQNYCTSLGIVKALGEAGYKVEVGRRVNRHPRLRTPEMKSKCVVKAAYLYMGSDDEMIKSIIDNFMVPDVKKILIPSDDFCVALIDRHLKELSTYFILPNVRNEQGAVIALMNKSTQNEMARKCGITVANSVIIKVSPNEKITIPETISYPCLAKPIESVGSPKSYIKKYDSQEELTIGLSQIASEHESTMLVEEFIDIEKEYTIPGIAVGPEVIIPAVIEKFKTGDGSHKGVTIAGKVHNSRVMRDFVDRLKLFVSKLGFQGIFDIELLQSNKGLFFNEINLRNGAAGYSLTKCGINLPAIYADYLTNSAIPQLPLSFSDGRTFVNEKAALENYFSGYSTFRTLLKTISSADIRFILNANDIMASISFCMLSLYLVTKKIIH